MENYLKDLKPLSFGGEEKEQNKDVVNMFLHKWGDIHSLRRNPKIVRLIEASLSLTGKAYKWWMSLKECPCSWEDFEKVFKKSFFQSMGCRDHGKSGTNAPWRAYPSTNTSLAIKR